MTPKSASEVLWYKRMKYQSLFTGVIKNTDTPYKLRANGENDYVIVSGAVGILSVGRSGVVQNKHERPQLRSRRDRAGVFNSKFSPGPLAMAAFCACALPHPQSSALAAAFCAHARPYLPPWATAHRNLASSAMLAGSMPAAPSAAGARSRLAPVRESPGTCASTRASSTASASASSATSHAGGARPHSPASSRCSLSRSGKLQIFKVMIPRSSKAARL
jgi:hypothetical protein